MTWEQGCGQELGPVPDLGELVVASQERLATMRHRGWALTIFSFRFCHRLAVPDYAVC